MEKRLAKITSASFGIGGYQDAQIGFFLGFEGEGWGIGTNRCDWALKRTKHCQWTEEDRIENLGKIVMELNEILKAAKVDTVEKLIGKPVEVTLEGNSLKDWRILTEVL